MSEIEKCFELYEMMANRCEKSGVSTNQAKAYRAIKEFISDCKSGEEMMDKLKNSPGYYEAVAKGLVLDKLKASEKAAFDNGYLELGKIYEERYKEVEQDYNKAFITGYEEKVKKFFRNHLQKIRHFVDIFSNYIQYLGPYPDKMHFEAMKNNYDALINMGTDFKTLGKNKEFRDCILLDDLEYEKYLNNLEQVINTGFDRSEEDKKALLLFDKAWSVLKDKESEVRRLGKLEEDKTFRAGFMVIPPDDENGKYIFTNGEKEEM